MRNILFAIKDNKSQKFIGVQHYENAGVFCRNISYQVNADNSSMLSFAPDDFDLYQLGFYDTDTGELIPDIKFIANASSLVRNVSK